jgi:uncharacterized protein YdaU (DUF1376 family)
MADRSDTWMPFYVGDYLSATGRLTTEQHGAYLLILLDYWKNGPPPNDDAVLAQIARLTLGAWRKAKPALIGYFEVRDGLLIQKRVEKERERATDITEKRSRAGKASAEARAKSNKPATPVPTRVGANGHHNGRPSQSQLQVSNETIASTIVDVSAEPTDKPLTVDEIVEAWNLRMVPQGFAAVRRLTDQRRKQTKARLRENTFDDWQAVFAAIERSAFLRGENDRGWRADFDFLLQPKSFTKILEGSYDH